KVEFPVPGTRYSNPGQIVITQKVFTVTGAFDPCLYHLLGSFIPFRHIFSGPALNTGLLADPADAVGTALMAQRNFSAGHIRAVPSRRRLRRGSRTEVGTAVGAPVFVHQANNFQLHFPD